jgi:hypothetical protein
MDVLATDEAETLAAHLLRHACAARDRHAELEGLIADEEVITRRADVEASAIRAEINQFHGWLSGELEGGAAYRMSKAIQDERERRAMLEGELHLLRTRLTEASASLGRLQELHNNNPSAQQFRAAEGALKQLQRLHALSEVQLPTEEPL